ncbi:MAG TPA: hypothetical protein VFV74_13690 [Burkholderiales bacterium]|nr:hypothetical protein [Burkholderiales bacterium]
MGIPRTLLVGAAIVVVAIVGALWWVYASRDSLVKQAIERFGPAITGVSVAVASVELEPLDGRGAIKGLALGNPPGFTAPHSLSLGEVRLALEPASIASRVVHIREIALESPRITYERTASGDNLSAIQKHIEAQLPKSSPAKAESAPGPERRFIVDRVQVHGARMSYGGTLDVGLPDLQLRDLGKKKGGATAAEITQEVWTALTRQALAAAPGAVRGLEEKAKGAVDKLRGLFK